MAQPEDLTEEGPPIINPYEVLELERGADERQIKTAYRKAALRHHPGKPPKSAGEPPFPSL